MEKYGSGFVGDGRLCMPGAAATRRVPQTEDLTRKLVGLGLLEANHLALSTTKKHYIPPPPPLLRRPPLHPTLDLSPPFQRFQRREDWEMEGAFEFSGGGYERSVVGRNAGVVERRPASGGAYGRGRMRQIHPQTTTWNLPVSSSQVCGGGRGRPTSIVRLQVPCHAPVVQTSRRRCGGTGVFLPRVVNPDEDEMFDPGLRGRAGFGTAGRLVQQAEHMELRAVAVAVGEQKPTSCHTPPPPPLPPVELLLPQDWSY